MLHILSHGNVMSHETQSSIKKNSNIDVKECQGMNTIFYSHEKIYLCYILFWTLNHQSWHFYVFWLQYGDIVDLVKAWVGSWETQSRSRSSYEPKWSLISSCSIQVVANLMFLKYQNQILTHKPQNNKILSFPQYHLSKISSNNWFKQFIPFSQNNQTHNDEIFPKLYQKR